MNGKQREDAQNTRKDEWRAALQKHNDKVRSWALVFREISNVSAEDVVPHQDMMIKAGQEVQCMRGRVHE